MAHEWPIDRTCLDAAYPLPDPEDDGYEAALARRNAAEDLAVHVLWALSGRQFGLADTTVRPCPTYAQGFGYLPYIYGYEAGVWTSWPCGCLSACTVTGPRVVHLPGPVYRVTEVQIAGTVLDAAVYQLEGDALYRKGGASWPHQDLSRPLGEPGTWSVTYQRGVPVPAGVDKLVAELAKEFMTACDDEDRCRIPRNLVSRSSRGTTHVFDPSRILAAGKTGLAEVDLWLAGVNPHHLIAAPVVL